MIEDPVLRDLFRAESEEHLARLDEGLLGLEKTPADQALLEEVFRESHSLKGAARMLGLSRIETTAHGLEGILNAARKGEAALDPQLIERMNGVLDELRALVREALADAPAAPPKTVPAPPQAPEPGGETVGKEEPGPPLPRDEVTAPAGENAAPPDADAAPAAPPPVHEERRAANVDEPFRIETVRVETRRLDDILTQLGELSVIEGRGRHGVALLDDLIDQWTALQRERHGQSVGSPREQLATRFGALLKEARDTVHEHSARLEATVGLLEDQVRSLRLLPLATVFSLFPRMVRDLARDQGKEVTFHAEGGEITVDKRILEQIKDPLMHLIRNAIGHGIEPPDERERQGKPRAGVLRLHSQREDGGILIEVSDDGRGLDIAAIRRTAAGHGLHDEQTLAAMTPAQLRQVIFLPGFSTSAVVTEVSGRGVGLDAVRVNIERLKGTIHVESETGKGVLVTVRLPLSLATSRLLLASAAGHLYGLPLDFVNTSLRLPPEEVFTLEGRPAVMLDGQAVVAARLADLLDLPAEDSGETPDKLACIVLQIGGERLGLLVDELVTEEEVLPKPLGAPLVRVRNVSGLAMLGSGLICPVLNPADLLRSARRFGGAPRPQSPHRGAAARSVILLVEDSALVRAMEKRVLEDAGYEVVTAVDGLEALDRLATHPVAAVVSDIVMPNLDGVTLTARIRAAPHYKDLPVILVTTLSSDADKQRGLEAGADAYLPKPTFDQQVLLETLDRLIAT